MDPVLPILIGCTLEGLVGKLGPIMKMRHDHSTLHRTGRILVVTHHTTQFHQRHDIFSRRRTLIHVNPDIRLIHLILYGIRLVHGKTRRILLGGIEGRKPRHRHTNLVATRLDFQLVMAPNIRQCRHFRLAVIFGRYPDLGTKNGIRAIGGHPSGNDPQGLSRRLIQHHVDHNHHRTRNIIERRTGLVRCQNIRVKLGGIQTGKARFDGLHPIKPRGHRHDIVARRIRHRKECIPGKPIHRMNLHGDTPHRRTIRLGNPSPQFHGLSRITAGKAKIVRGPFRTTLDLHHDRFIQHIGQRGIARLVHAVKHPDKSRSNGFHMINARRQIHDITAIKTGHDLFNNPSLFLASFINPNHGTGYIRITQGNLTDQPCHGHQRIRSQRKVDLCLNHHAVCILEHDEKGVGRFMILNHHRIAFGIQADKNRHKTWLGHFHHIASRRQTQAIFAFAIRHGNNRPCAFRTYAQEKYFNARKRCLRLTFHGRRHHKSTVHLGQFLNDIAGQIKVHDGLLLTPTLDLKRCRLSGIKDREDAAFPVPTHKHRGTARCLNLDQVDPGGHANGKTTISAGSLFDGLHILLARPPKTQFHTRRIFGFCCCGHPGCGNEATLFGLVRLNRQITRARIPHRTGGRLCHGLHGDLYASKVNGANVTHHLALGHQIRRMEHKTHRITLGACREKFKDLRLLGILGGIIGVTGGIPSHINGHKTLGLNLHLIHTRRNIQGIITRSVGCGTLWTLGGIPAHRHQENLGTHGRF